VTSFASESFRLLRRILRGAGPAPAHAGKRCAIDGVSAVAAVEARLAEVAGLGASYPAALAARAWLARASGPGANASGDPLSAMEADSPRAALASAMGATLAGRRAAVFLSGPDLLQCRDLIGVAAGQHLPLVVHVVLRAGAGHAQALGSGHEAYHALADEPCIRLMASSVQEAIDLTIVARRVAELALTPVVVAMDAEQTALAVQDAAMPDDALLIAYVGAPGETIPTPTAGQRAIYGDARRRIPRAYDLARPTLVGALQGPEAWALGAAAGRAFFAPEAERLLQEAAEAYAARTGRRVAAVRTHSVDGAQVVLVAQGSLVEHAAAIADWSREQRRTKVGVVGVVRGAPLDGAGLARALRGARVACTLERIAVSPGDDGPLAREIRAVLDRCRENALQAGTHHGLPALSPKETPRLVTAAVGLGGLPVRAAHLAALLAELESPRRSAYYVGLEFTRRASEFPKHQALLDSLRRDFPDAAGLGLRATEDGPAPAAQALTTVSVVRAAGAGAGAETLAGEVAALAHGFLGGGVRSRPGISWQRAGEICEDRVSFGPGAICDPGDDVRIDVAVLAADSPEGAALARASVGARLADDAIVVTNEQSGRDSESREASREALLGATLRRVLERAGASVPGAKQARVKREEMLGGLAAAELEARLGAFVRGYESAPAVQSGDADPRSAEPGETGAPAAVRRMRTTGRADDLPRFWDHEGVLYRSGRTDELVAEPMLATGTAPALSATLRDVGRGVALLPVFDPAACDGAPELWTTCPDGSVAPLVIGPRALLDAGIDLATRAGEAADALRPLASQLAKRMAKLAAGDAPPISAGELLRTSFEEVAAKLDAPAERREAMAGALNAVLRQIGVLPLAVTDVFFREPERAAPGTGAFLTLAVNPDACKSPELLAARCAGHGLRVEARTPEAVAAAREVYRLWERLPDTPGEVIERARKDERIGTLAAMMLSRHCLHAMAPGDGAEAASGAKLALRQVLAVAEFHGQPRAQKLLGEIETLRTKLADRIQSLLAKALPTADLDALGQGLDALGRGEVELSALSARIDSAIVDGHVDGGALGRLVDVARGVADLRWTLREGPLGLGRARVGLTIAAGAVAKWSAAFPYNPFAAPTAVDACAEAGGLARGLVEAHMREAVDAARLLRLAKVELERPAEAPHAAAALRRLTFADLTAEERELSPPMLLVGDGQGLGRRGLAQVVWLLESGLPVKVVLLSDIGGRADSALSLDALGAFPATTRYDAAVLAMLGRKAFVCQTSIAHEEHFAASVERALAAAGPALVHVHAPSPERHGFAPERLFEQAALAVRSRAWPLFMFDPAGPGVFGSCLDITANPSPCERWASDEAGRACTPADWAATEARFEGELTPLEAGAPGATPIAEYLELAAKDRAGRTPFVEAQRGGAAVRLPVGARLLDDTIDRTRLWRTLEELAGEVTPFTDKVRAEAERAVAGAHKAELARLTAEHEQRIAQLQAEFDAMAAERVTARLMALAGLDGGGRA
jgi:pyruvate-ferredoxin/flavodoxin oxidoreductase